jgi:hypothetical protein
MVEGMGYSELTEELLALERRGWDSLCDGTGADFYGELMTEDGVMVLANGMTLDRGQVVASLREAPTWSRFELSNEQVVGAGTEAAVLHYLGRAYRGDEPPFVARMSSLYVRQGGRWRLALYQ